MEASHGDASHGDASNEYPQHMFLQKSIAKF